VIDDNEVNASCAPGGFVIVNEGLLVKMPTDEELAFTLAHEIGHAMCRHTSRLIRRMQADKIFDAAALVLSSGRYQGTDRRLSYLAFSRENEAEADAFGTELYLRAGFTPANVADAMRVLVHWEEESGGRDTPEYLSSHSNPRSRVDAILSSSARLISSGLEPLSAGGPVDASLKTIYGDMPASPAEGNPLQPDTPGTEWIYSITGANSSSHYSVKVASRVQVANWTVARLETVVGGVRVPYQIMADKDRLLRRDRPDLQTSPWKVSLALVNLGSPATVDGVQYAREGEDTIDTPAGKFAGCVKFSIHDAKDRVIRVWYAPGVGLVKRVNETSGVTELLVEFRRGA